VIGTIVELRYTEGGTPTEFSEDCCEMLLIAEPPLPIRHRERRGGNLQAVPYFARRGAEAMYWWGLWVCACTKTEMRNGMNSGPHSQRGLSSPICLSMFACHELNNASKDTMEPCPLLPGIDLGSDGVERG